MEPCVIQNDGSYALTLEFASGMVSPSILETVNQIVQSEGARVHLTTSQKVMILDLSEESARQALELLKAVGARFKFPKQVYQPRVSPPVRIGPMCGDYIETLVWRYE
jgi:dissimilatory sulfite reductase (desulfoviridin) alpha/beta subunit